MSSRLVCPGCGFEMPATERYPFRCPNAAAHDNIDHVLRRVLDPGGLADPEALFDDGEPNPILRYRRLFHVHHLAEAQKIDKGVFARETQRLDEAIAQVDGKGFRESPFLQASALGQTLGLPALWVKDETGNVSGSHKARHLAPLMILLEIQKEEAPSGGAPSPLAISSCGNAALAAAVVARAAGHELNVFVPTDTDPAVLARLQELGAVFKVCPRDSGTSGDPCYHAFEDAVRKGALPFSCQGSDNALILDGGKALAWEVISASRRNGLELDRILIQVGGGALASSFIQGYEEALALGVVSRLPRFHTIQTRSAQPLITAWNALLADLPSPPEDLPPADLEKGITRAARCRSRYMRPWPETPRSVATGILDDETYDWLAIVRGMLLTGGSPIAVSEVALAEANALARRATSIPVDPTGSSGLAGLMELRGEGKVAPEEHVAVLFTGAVR